MARLLQLFGRLIPGRTMQVRSSGLVQFTITQSMDITIVRSTIGVIDNPREYEVEVCSVRFTHA